MTDEVMVSKLTEHDRHIDALSSAVEHLVETASVTNTKLDKMVDVLSAQNVFKERLNNTEENLKESFSRVHATQGATSMRLDKMSATVENIPTPATIRWFVGLMVAYTIISANYVVGSLHTLDTDTLAHYASCDIHQKNFTERFEKLEEIK